MQDKGKPKTPSAPSKPHPVPKPSPLPTPREPKLPSRDIESPSRPWPRR